MAHRRKKVTHHRRRVGATGKLNPDNAMVKIAAIAAGYFLGTHINDAIDKATQGKIDGKIVAAAEAGVGGLLLLSKSKKPSLLKTIAGGVLAGSGIHKGLTEFGVIAATVHPPVVKGWQRVPVLNGYQSVPVLGGYNTRPGSMNGYQVPVPVHKSVMGSVGGIDVSNGGLGYMDSDR